MDPIWINTWHKNHIICLSIGSLITITICYIWIRRRRINHDLSRLISEVNFYFLVTAINNWYAYHKMENLLFWHHTFAQTFTHGKFKKWLHVTAFSLNCIYGKVTLWVFQKLHWCPYHSSLHISHVVNYHSRVQNELLVHVSTPKLHLKSNAKLWDLFWVSHPPVNFKLCYQVKKLPS